MTWWEAVAGGLVGGLVGGTLGAWLSARWREHSVRTLLERMDRWGVELRAGHEQLEYHLGDGDPVIDPTLHALLAELDRRGGDSGPPPGQGERRRS